MAHSPLFRSFVRVLQSARAANRSAASLPPPVPAAALGPSLSRRRVLKTGAAASALLLAPRVKPAFSRGPGARVAVLGGGIAGLSAAWHLREAGHKPTVYEATGRTGGRMRSGIGLVADGIVTEYGGQYVNSDHLDVIAHAERYGIALVNVRDVAATLGIPDHGYNIGGFPMTEAEVADALRPLAGRIAADAARLDADWDAAAPELDALSVAAWLGRHRDAVTPEVYGLISAVIRTEYGVEPGEASVLGLLFALPTVEGEAVDLLSSSDEMFMVEGGSERIVAALAQDLGEAVELGRRAARIEAHGAGQRIGFRDGTAVDVDATVVAVALTALKRIEITAPLPDAMADFIANVNLGRNEKVFAGFSTRPWHRPDGFATDIWSDRVAALVWDDGLRQPDLTQSGLTFFCGGAEVDGLHEEGPEAFAARALAHFGKAYPWLAPAYNGNAGDTAWTRTPYLNGAYTNFAPGQQTGYAACLWIESDEPAERTTVAAGTLSFAGEPFSDAFYGYMNGAAQTGRLAAQAVVEAMATLGSAAVE